MLATVGADGDITGTDGQPLAFFQHFATATENEKDFLFAFVDMHADRTAGWDAHVGEKAAFAMKIFGLQNAVR